MAIVKELLLRGVKVLDIGFVTFIYFSLGMFFAKAFDNLYGPFKERKEKKKSFIKRFLEIVGMMWLSGIIIYIVRNTVELIPFPFDGLFGFNHLQLKELTNAGVFTFIFLYFQSHLRSKLVFFYDNLSLNRKNR